MILQYEEKEDISQYEHRYLQFLLLSVNKRICVKSVLFILSTDIVLTSLKFNLN